VIAAHALADSFEPAALDRTERLIHDSLTRVQRWVEEHNYEAYEPFDGLSSPLGRVTRMSPLMDRLLQQVGRQSPVNFRPLLGVKPLPSTKGRGYMAAGYLQLYKLTGDAVYRRKAVSCLDWLIEHKSPKFAEHSWANHFDYASRGGRYGKHESIVVWTALVGQAFLDAFELLGESRFLEVADSACRWILQLPRERTASGICLSYHMLEQNSVHNASMLGAAMLARTWRFVRNAEYRELAAAAMEYSCTRQRPDGSWWYGEDSKYHWVDNFHTGYNLDSLKCYIESTGDHRFVQQMDRGFEYFLAHFFEPSGLPKYYHDRAYPIDIQAAAQAIETLAKFGERSDSLLTSVRVAQWTIDRMQDPDGYFYYRRYPLLVARIPMLHWGQATMFHALALLLARLHARHA
jgi:rhamnogalacturonyl hydrolase YesR